MLSGTDIRQSSQIRHLNHPNACLNMLTDLAAAFLLFQPANVNTVVFHFCHIMCYDNHWEMFYRLCIFHHEIF